MEGFGASHPGLTKLDKLNLVNLLPVTKGDLYLVVGDRFSDELLIPIIKKYKDVEHVK